MQLFSIEENIENNTKKEDKKETKIVEKQETKTTKKVEKKTQKVKEIEEDVDDRKIRELKKIETFSNIETSILNQFKQNKLHHATMLSGKYGIGKATFAYWLITQLILQTCENKENSSNLKEMHIEMLKRNIHPDVFFLELLDGENEIKIEQIRNFIEKISLKSTYGNKFVIIDDINSINNNGVNALLKTLEEPPENTYFFIINHQNTQLLDTIYSRCNEIKMKFTKNDCVKILYQQNQDLKDDEIEFYATASCNSVRLSNILMKIEIKKIIEENKDLKTSNLLNLIYKTIDVNCKDISKITKISLLENILFYFINKNIKLDNNENTKTIVSANNSLIKQFNDIKTFDLPVLFV